MLKVQHGQLFVDEQVLRQVLEVTVGQVGNRRQLVRRLYTPTGQTAACSRITSHQVFLLKRLRDQGLTVKHPNTVFQARIVSRLLYALPSWGCFVTAELSGKIEAFLRRAHRYGLAANILTVTELFDSVAQDFFQQNPIA